MGGKVVGRGLIQRGRLQGDCKVHTPNLAKLFLLNHLGM